jgi:hypothetical protein
MNIDERIEALTMNLELAMKDIEASSRSIEALQVLAKQDGENIRALVRIAEIHERRLTALEGDDQ